MKPREGAVQALGPHGFTRVAYFEWGPEDAAQSAKDSGAVLCLEAEPIHGQEVVSR